MPLRRTLRANIPGMKGGDMDESTFDRNALGGEAGRLLEALLLHVNDDGRAQVPTTVLLKESGLTQGAMIRARSELTQRGLLRTEPGFSSSGLRGANVYVLDMTAIEPPSIMVPEGETGRTGEDDSFAPGHLVSGEVPTPSGRHRTERKSLWRRLLGKEESS